MDDLSRFCCQNSHCPDHGRRGGQNLSVCGRYGQGDRFRLLYCRTCKTRFSERKGTPLFNCRLSDEQARAVPAHVAEGGGVRGTSRLLGVHRDTVTRLTRLSGAHAQALHEELVAVSPSDRRVADGREVGVRRQEAESLR
jgi:LacI family transcriptional regulator